MLEFPPYAPPAWLNILVPPGHGQAFDVPAPGLGDGAVVGVRTWSPPGVTDGQPLPLLVVHDGPEYDLRAALTHLRGLLAPGGRIVLVDPYPADSLLRPSLGMTPQRNYPAFLNRFWHTL